jgi:glutaredoxin
MSEKKLNVYVANWCPHCRAAIRFLDESGLEYVAHDMEKVSEEVEKLVVKANGGDDWVVPTLEYDGKWIEGKFFDETSFTKDLKKLGVI